MCKLDEEELSDPYQANPYSFVLIFPLVDGIWFLLLFVFFQHTLMFLKNY